MTLIGLDYLKHQEQARANRANEALKDRELTSKVEIADADRLSKEGIASLDRTSKENIASLDRESRATIAEADRINNLEIAKLSNANKTLTTSISAVGSGLLGAGIGAAGRIASATLKYGTNRKGDDNDQNTPKPPSGTSTSTGSLTFQEVMDTLKADPEKAKKLGEDILKHKREGSLGLSSEARLGLQTFLNLLTLGLSAADALSFLGNALPIPVGG